ncbi:MAG: SIMPL domain-containing protein [Candidatus Pacearchaeota archaeon]|jgi:hypothetical protein
MEKSIKITLIIVLTVVFLVLISLYFVSQTTATNTVSANGQSTIKAVPDLVTIYFSVETKNTSAQLAKDANSEIVQKVKTGLINAGFNEDKLTTESFNVYPNYDWSSGKQTTNGYIATHSLKLELSTEEMDKLGSAVDAGVNAGALVNYINFELTEENQNKYKAEALKQAAEDAKIKAEAIASGLDKKLGRLVSTSNSDFGYSPWNVYSKSESASGVALDMQRVVSDISPSEEEISATVSVTYKLR